MANLKYKHTAYTSAQWASLNPVIVENEIVIESDTKRTKIGNGISTYNQLEYADANSIGNSLGSIKSTDAAPTPGRNGNYTFSIGGNKPAWLTAEAGVTTVKAGDGVSVVYTAPSSYTYTHVKIDRISDIYNVTVEIPLAAGQFYTSTTARAAVPVGVRKSGLMITYATASGVWMEDQYIGSDLSGWETETNWENLILNDKFYLSLYPILDKVGYYDNGSGTYHAGDYNALASDFKRVYKGDSIKIKSDATIGGSASFINCYDINKTWIKSVNLLQVIDFEGYVTFNCFTNTYASDSFLVLSNRARNTEEIVSKLISFELQTLTENQRKQARNNIDAAKEQLTYIIANKVGYVSNSNGAINQGEYNARYTDYTRVMPGDLLSISNTLTTGSSGSFINCFDTNKTWIKSVSVLETVDFDGYVIFQANTSSITETSFSVMQTVSNQLSPIKSDIISLSNAVSTLQPDVTNLLISDLGQWHNNFGSTVTWDNDYKAAKIITSNEDYSGIQMSKDLDLVQYIVEFEAKTLSNMNEWALTSSNFQTLQSELFYPEKKWKKFKVIIAACDSSHRNFTFYQRENEVQTLLVRKFKYSKLNTLEELQFNNEIEVQNTKLSVSDNGSLGLDLIDKSISDINLPTWIGNSELRTTDITPSINTQGKSYLFNNDGTIELRIVKDAHSVFGVSLNQKLIKSITPKSRSIVFIGDSRTIGVGTSAGNSYPEKVRDLLVVDGHTISKFTIKGQFGASPSGLKNYVDSLSIDPHDVAVLMIGTGALDSWMSGKYPDENGSCNPSGFRELYRRGLNSLISSIYSYCSFSKLFLVVETPMRLVYPDKPTVDRYNALPLYDIIVQETLYAAKGISNIFICRGDYYLINPSESDLPDYIHPSNSGALKLAQGVRDEMTYLM